MVPLGAVAVLQRILPIVATPRAVAPLDLLRVQGATARYFSEAGVGRTVENVSFRVCPGEVLEVGGASGKART